MITQLKAIIRRWVIEHLTDEVIQSLAEDGLTETDQAFVTAKLNSNL